MGQLQERALTVLVLTGTLHNLGRTSWAKHDGALLKHVSSRHEKLLVLPSQMNTAWLDAEANGAAAAALAWQQVGNEPNVQCTNHPLPVQDNALRS